MEVLSPYLTRLNYHEACSVMQPLRPDFVKLLQNYDLDDSYPFYKVAYPFGAHLLKDECFFLPDENGNLKPLSTFPESIQADLSYSTPLHPAGMNLNKNIEQFVILDERVVPFYLFGPGEFLGFAAILDRLSSQKEQGFYNSFNMWEITTGSRSVFMLSRISDQTAYKRLQKAFHLKTPPPNSSHQQWNLFRELALKAESPWRSEILFFPKKLIHHFQDTSYTPLLNFFRTEHRALFAFWRNQFSWQVTLSYIERLKRLKYSAHLLDTVKHLFALALGAIPASQPATTEVGLPAQLIEKTFLEHYHLETMPTVIEPALFKHQNPVYYSLNHPTSVEYAPKSSQTSSNIADLEEISLILSKFIKTLTEDKPAVTHPLLEKLARDSHFDFFHSQNEHHQHIQSVETLLREDARFQILQSDNTQALALPRNSSFFKGCIRIR